MPFTITDFNLADPNQQQQVAEILVAAFADNWPTAWPTLKDAYAEIQDSIDSDIMMAKRLI